MYLNWPKCTKIIHQSDLSPVLGWSLQSLPIDQAAAHSNCGDLLGVVARPVNSHLCHGHSGSLGRRLPDPDSCAYKMVSICQYAYYWSNDMIQWDTTEWYDPMISNIEWYAMIIYDPMGYYWLLLQWIQCWWSCHPIMSAPAHQNLKSQRIQGCDFLHALARRKLEDTWSLQALTRETTVAQLDLIEAHMSYHDIM